MSCLPCSKSALQFCVGRIDRKLQAHASVGKCLIKLRVISVRSLHTQNPFRSPSAQPHPNRSHSIDEHLPFVNDSISSSSLKQDGHVLGQKQGPSGLGAVGQQIKDLQEHVSSIIMQPDGVSGGEGSPRKASRSTPARLARRERRRPRRRFEGDRTRPEVKHNSSPENIKPSMEHSSRRDEATKISGAKRPLKRGTGARSENKDTTQLATEQKPRDKKSQGAKTVEGVFERHTSVAKRPRDKKPRGAKTADGVHERPTRVVKTSTFPEESTVEDEQSYPQRESWGIQKEALKEKFGETGWQPRKRLSPDALDGIRALHAKYPESYSTPVLAQHFKISPEAIRRILKSKWTPNEEEEEKRKQRWEKRGEKIWEEMSKQGLKPPKMWREKGIGKLPERDGNRRRRPLATLEEKIGTESNRVIISTRVVALPQPQKPLAQKIF